VVLREMVRRNRIDGFGIVYLQVTRGTAVRAHAFPPAARPTLVMTARRLPMPTIETARQGVRVILQPDLRWQRCDIKTVGLLPNVLSRQRAVAAGAYEAWLVDDGGRVTEGAASNAWIVTGEGRVVTRPAEPAILNGVTRVVVIDLARRQGIDLEERPFTVAEAKSAAEAFLTSTSSLIKPVIRIDDQVISGGRIGTLTERLQRAYFRHLDEQGMHR
jgi:D-alanine transaminase